MPIYLYKCPECNAIVEVIQKLSDPPILGCPQCVYDGQLEKQVTAASFQFNGNGYYQTDFKNK